MPLGQRLDELSSRLDRRTEALIREGRLRLQSAAESMRAIQPQRLIDMVRIQIDRTAERLTGAARARIQFDTHNLTRLAERYQAVHPKQVLRRGFSVVECGGKLVRTAAEVQAGDTLAVTMSEGELRAVVKERILS
jgi:exodeoxyribonuclease VII large subunit